MAEAGALRRQLSVPATPPAIECQFEARSDRTPENRNFAGKPRGSSATAAAIEHYDVTATGDPQEFQHTETTELERAQHQIDDAIVHFIDMKTTGP